MRKNKFVKDDSWNFLFVWNAKSTESAITGLVKFTEKGGEIEISVYSENNFVYINIKNSGKGINNQDIQKIFDRFYKTDASRSLDITGIGLGLSIVKKLLNFNNGNIFCNIV